MTLTGQQLHLVNKNHMIKTFHKNEIFVSDIPQCIIIDNLITLFQKYGKVVEYRIVDNGHKNLIVKFNDTSPVKTLTSQNICIHGTKLNIVDLCYVDRTVEKIEEISYNNINTIFSNNMSFYSQLEAFLNKISLNNKEIETSCKSICLEVNQIFQSIFPKCKTHRFGSTLVGTGFKNSDLDLYINIGIPIMEENSTSLGPHVITKDKLFSIVEGIMNDNPHIFATFYLIPQAQTPIVKLTHRKTNISCDISFKSKMGVYNSELIKFCLSINPRFRPLMMIIKYWMKICERKSYVGITTYALTILLIFYLQQIKLIPPIIELQNKCMIAVTIKDWQVNFNKNLSWFESDDNYRNKSIPRLLEGFFEFYENYEFESNVICPGDGKPCDKNLFVNIESLPESMLRYKKYLEENEHATYFDVSKSMCLQDPIELNSNLTKNIRLEHLQKFQLFCTIAKNSVRNTVTNNYQTLIQHLFSLKIPKADQQGNNNQCVTFSISSPNFVNVNSNEIILKKNSFIKSNWFDLTFAIIKQYLQEVLKFEITINDVDKKIYQEMLRFEYGKFQTQNAIVLHCNSSHCLWLNRENYEICDLTINPLQKEIDISKKILKKTFFINESENIFINFDCYFITITESVMQIVLILVDKGCSGKLFTTLEHHLQYQMTTVINKTLKFIRTHSNLHLDKKLIK